MEFRFIPQNKLLGSDEIGLSKETNCSSCSSPLKSPFYKVLNPHLSIFAAIKLGKILFNPFGRYRRVVSTIQMPFTSLLVFPDLCEPMNDLIVVIGSAIDADVT